MPDHGIQPSAASSNHVSQVQERQVPDASLRNDPTPLQDHRRHTMQVPRLQRRKSLTDKLVSKFQKHKTYDAPWQPLSSRPSEPPFVPPVPSSSSSFAPSLNGINSHSRTVTASDLNLAWSTISPPPFPTPLQYQSHYCEENVYLLIQQLASTLARRNQKTQKLANKLRKSKPGASSSSSSKSLSSLASSSDNRGSSQSLFVQYWDLRAIFISNPTKSVLLYQQRASKLPNTGSPVIWDYHVMAAVTSTLVPLSQVLQGEGNGKAPEQLKEIKPQQEALPWTRTWVYDMDSMLSIPAPSPDSKTTSTTMPADVAPQPVLLEQYVELTFVPNGVESGLISAHLQSWFRVIPANRFLEFFASDRSHMLQEDGKTWHQAPPTWPTIQSKGSTSLGIRNNLMQNYVDVLNKDHQGRYGMVWDTMSFFNAEWTNSSSHDNLPGGTLEGDMIIPVEGDKDMNGSTSSKQRTVPPSDSTKKKKKKSEKMTKSLSMPASLSSGANLLPSSARKPQSTPVTPNPSKAKKNSGLSSLKSSPPPPRPPPFGQSGDEDGPKRGGRVTSPLFPAYVYALQQHRVESSEADSRRNTVVRADR